jgi:hypothetical protein
LPLENYCSELWHVKGKDLTILQALRTLKLQLPCRVLQEITMNAKRADVPHEVLARLRPVCLDLSEAYEEEAWAGTRWMVVKKNFAHVLMIDAGWPPAYARAAGADGPLCVLTFRISAAATGALRFERPPFFRPVWWPNIVGLTLDVNTDWDEVAALLTRSYVVLAPKKLAALVDGVPE